MMPDNRPDKTGLDDGPYVVADDPNHPPCPCCKTPGMYWIIGPDGVGGGKSYADDADAHEDAAHLNEAYYQGRASVRAELSLGGAPGTNAGLDYMPAPAPSTRG